MLVGHIFEILVSFWVVGGRLGACWRLKGVIGAFQTRLEGGGTLEISMTGGFRGVKLLYVANGGNLRRGVNQQQGDSWLLQGNMNKEKGERKMEKGKRRKEDGKRKMEKANSMD